MTDKNVDYCYMTNTVDEKSTYSLYKVMTIRLEDKPVARFWKKCAIFNSKHELDSYCSSNGILKLSENQYVIDGKVEYLN